MNRREVVGLLVATANAVAGTSLAAGADAGVERGGKASPPAPVAPLPHVKGERIPVAFVIAPGAEVVDFTGPWGVFEYVYLPDEETNPFQLFTVADTIDPLKVSGGMTVVADHAFVSAPQPKVIVVPALLGDPSPALLDWLVKASKGADMTMSVCNGAFVLAKAGLLAGKSATSHHGAYALFQADFPDVEVRRGARFVDEGSIATSGGLMSGIDLTLHVVARYFGGEIAQSTATALEYQGQGWRDPNSNAEFAKKPVSTDDHPVCPVCELEVDKRKALTGSFRNKMYFFCSEGDKERFERTPDRFVDY